MIECWDDLTPLEQELAELHDIELWEIYDATSDGRSLSNKEYQNDLKKDGYQFVINTTPHHCGDCFKTRKGHCIICNPSAVAFLRRHSVDGYVYLAFSPSTQLIKIGTTTCRRKFQNYGGVDDWKIILKSPLVKNSGQCEGELHTSLSNFRVYGRYYDRSGVTEEAKEIYALDLNVAKAYFLQTQEDWERA